MKKQIIKVSFFFLALFSGIGALGFFNLFLKNLLPNESVQKQNVEQVPIETTICRLKEDSDNFTDKIVTFVALIPAFENNESEIPLNSIDCQQNETIAFRILNLDLEAFDGKIINLANFPENPSSEIPILARKEVVVKITGVVKRIPNHYGLRTHKIIPYNIEAISLYFRDYH